MCLGAVQGLGAEILQACVQPQVFETVFISLEIRGGGLRPLEVLRSEAQPSSSGLRRGEKQSKESCFIFQKNIGILLFQLPSLWLKKNTAKRLLLRLNKQTN